MSSAIVDKENEPVVKRQKVLYKDIFQERTQNRFLPAIQLAEHVIKQYSKRDLTSSR